MGEGLPFDITDNDEGRDYTLFDVTEISEDDDDDQYAFDEEPDMRDQKVLQDVMDETNRLTKQGEQTMEEVRNLIERVRISTSASTTDSSNNRSSQDDLSGGAASSRNEHRRIHLLNQELCSIRDKIKETEAKKTDMELQILRAATKKTSFEIRKAIKENDIASVHNAVLAAESVDLCFILDATTSMMYMIERVKTNIQQIVSQVRRTNIHLNLRLAVVVYRDLEYHVPFEVLDFVTNVDEFVTFVGSIQSIGEEGRSGSRDTPEDMAGGIQKANQLSWRHATRVVFLIADSPCHGQEFHDDNKDNYPNGTPGINIKKELSTLINLCPSIGTMSVFFGRMTPRTDKMMECFHKSGLSLCVVPDITKPQEVVRAVSKGVRSSIFKTITTTAHLTDSHSCALGRMSKEAESLLLRNSGTNPKFQSTNLNVRLKSYQVVPHLPCVAEWKCQPSVLVKVYRNKSVVSIEQLLKPIPAGIMRFIGRKVASLFKSSNKSMDGKNNDTEEQDATMMAFRRADAPFAEGSIRIAYHGQLACEKDDLDLDKSNVVVKSFKHIGKEINGLRQYLRQMEISNIAHFLATEYSKIRPLHCGVVHVLKSCVVEEVEDVNEEQGLRRFCAEEPLPEESEFIKFSNNTGHWNPNELHETLLRFTQFTYHVTNGYMLVTDLQGVKIMGNNSGTDDFYLTDPAILCTDVLRFGYTNLGEKFMDKCLDATKYHLKECGWD